MTRINIATETALTAEASTARAAETALVLTTLRFGWAGGPTSHLNVTGLGTFAGPGSDPLYAAGMLPGLVKVAPAGSIINTMGLTASNIPVNDSDVLDFGVTITVSDLTMTNVLVLHHGAFTNVMSATSFSTALDESTCTPSITGSDLSIASGNITSTAGGVFVVSYSFYVVWD